MSTDSPFSAEEIAARLENHSFAHVDNGFTVDPDTGNDGVADLRSDDWHVRTLAVRDLIRLGRETPAPVLGMLDHDDKHVRQIAAMALGVLGDDSAAEALSRRLRDDPDPVVRSQAAIALGQILRMIETGEYEFEAPPPRRGPH